MSKLKHRSNLASIFEHMKSPTGHVFHNLAAYTRLMWVLRDSSNLQDFLVQIEVFFVLRRRLMSCALPKSSNSSGQSGLSLVPGQNNNPVVMVGPAGQRTQVTSLEQINIIIRIYSVFLLESLKLTVF